MALLLQTAPPSRRPSSTRLPSLVDNTKRKWVSNITISNPTATSQSLILTRVLDPILRTPRTAQTSTHLPHRTSTLQSSSTPTPLTSRSRPCLPLSLPSSKSAVLCTLTRLRKWETTRPTKKIRKTTWSSLIAFRTSKTPRAKTAPVLPAPVLTTTPHTKSQSTATRKSPTWWQTTTL